MLLRRKQDDYTNAHPCPSDVLLLIEVSDSSLDFDYDAGEKLTAYGKAGIVEVWIVNLEEQMIEIHRDPHFTGFASKILARSGEQAAPAAFPDAAVDVADLLRR
jgi:Uma2 family endonuclease